MDTDFRKNRSKRVAIGQKKKTSDEVSEVVDFEGPSLDSSPLVARAQMVEVAGVEP